MDCMWPPISQIDRLDRSLSVCIRCTFKPSMFIRCVISKVGRDAPQRLQWKRSLSQIGRELHRLKAAAAATTLLRLIFQCHNIAHTRPSPSKPLSPLFQLRLSHSQRRRRIWPPPRNQVGQTASNLASSGHDQPCNLPQPWVTTQLARQQSRGQSEAAIGGKAIIQSCDNQRRKADREEERPGVLARGKAADRSPGMQPPDRQGCHQAGRQAGRAPNQPNCTSRLLNLRPATFLKLAKKYQTITITTDQPRKKLTNKNKKTTYHHTNKQETNKQTDDNTNKR